MQKPILAILGCLGAAAVLAAPAGAAPSFGGCQLQGTVAISPGLNTTSHAFSYSFSGGLTPCQSTQSKVPLTGSVSAGKKLSEKVKNSVTGTTDTVTYQEPIPTGTGTCGSSTTTGQALVTWADHSTTVASYSTTGVAAAVELSGKVVSGLVLKAVNAKTGDPKTYTIKTTRYLGDTADGQLTFQPPDPTACNAKIGVTSAAINGAIDLGSTS